MSDYAALANRLEMAEAMALSQAEELDAANERIAELTEALTVVVSSGELNYRTPHGKYDDVVISRSAYEKALAALLRRLRLPTLTVKSTEPKP